MLKATRQAPSPKVYICILNWNGWTDTIECLESVMRLAYDSFQVVVCDNDSEDDSLRQIRRWANGALTWPLQRNHPLQHLTRPPLAKPVEYVQYERAVGEKGGASADPRLVLIQTGENLGFAGGNNVGLRYALARGDAEYVWLLNNDTVVPADSLTHLVERMESNPRAGICGSLLRYYDDPSQVQAFGGGTYSRWSGVARHLSNLRPREVETSVSAAIDYVVGASMLVRRRFLEEVGLLCEDYFLYHEELDWALRSRSRFSLEVALQSIVYHKEGSSIGSDRDPSKKSEMADYYALRSRLLIARRFFPAALPFIYLSMAGVVINRIRRKQWARAAMVVRLVAGSLLTGRGFQERHYPKGLSLPGAGRS